MSAPLSIPPDLVGQSSLYNHPDPLLRRLRLDDSSGGSITNLDSTFKGKEVLVLYAGSEHGASASHPRSLLGGHNKKFADVADNLKEFHRNLTRLGMKEFKTCSIIYISTDTNPDEPKRVLASQPWLRMTFCDNSDFAPLVPLRDGDKVTEMEEIARGEDFVQAGELEMGAESVTFGEDEYQHDYVRPLSRAAVTVLMRSFSTPSVSVYHLPTHQFLSRNVKLSSFEPGKIEQNYRTWQNGGTPTIRLYEVLYTMRYTLIALILALVYHALVRFGGEQYNVLPGWIDKLSWRSRELGARFGL